MSGLELTSFITAIANWIACEVDDDELDLLSDIFSQLEILFQQYLVVEIAMKMDLLTKIKIPNSIYD